MRPENILVKHLRDERGLTLQEMHAETGIHPSVISRIENGARITGDNAIRLAQWSGRPVADFFNVGNN